MIRLYCLRHIESGIEYTPLTGFEPMTHKEVCCFKSKLMRPNDWIIIQL